jgi:hypothetical protein
VASWASLKQCCNDIRPGDGHRQTDMDSHQSWLFPNRVLSDRLKALLLASMLSVKQGNESDDTGVPFFTPALACSLSPGWHPHHQFCQVSSEMTIVPILPVYSSSSPVALNHW